MRRAAPILLLALAALLWALWPAGGNPPPEARPAVDPVAGADPVHLHGRAPGAPEAPPAPESAANAPRPARWVTRGRVVLEGSERGVPNARVAVEVVRGDLREEVGTAWTSRDGDFSLLLPALDALSPAQLAASRLEYRVTADARYRQRRFPARGVPVYLGDHLADRRPHVELPVVLDGILRLCVEDVDGRPVEGARFSVGWKRAGSGGSVTIGDGGPPLTDARGESLYTLMPRYSSVTVHASKRGVGESGHVTHPFHDDEGPVRFPTLVLRGPGTIRGRAVFPDGTAVCGAGVYCVLREGERVPPGNATDSARTDAEGRFVLQGLWRARGRVGLSKPRTLDRAWTVSEVPVATGDTDVLLEIPIPRVRLHIVDESGAPVAGQVAYRAVLEGEGPPDVVREQVQAPDGTSSIWGRPGDRITVVAYGAWLRPSEAVCDLPPGVWTRDVALVVRPWDKASFGRVRFVVTDAEGEEAGPLRPYLRTPLVRQWVGRVFLGTDGRNVRWETGDAALPAPPGRWLLELRAAGEGPPRWPHHRQAIEVRPGEETVVRATVTRVASLALRLVPPGGSDPELRWWARLTPDDGHDRPVDKVSGPRRDYRWRLRPGGWTLRLEAGGYETISQHVVLEPGGNHELELPLVPR